MKSTYEINTKTTDKMSVLNMSAFVADDVATETAMEIIMSLKDNGFRFTEDGRRMVRAWGSISNNEVIEVSYVLMATLPYPEVEVPCVRYSYHREEYPGYEMIDHREDYEGGATWESFKKRYIKGE